MSTTQWRFYDGDDQDWWLPQVHLRLEVQYSYAKAFSTISDVITWPYVGGILRNSPSGTSISTVVVCKSSSRSSAIFITSSLVWAPVTCLAL